MAAGFDARSFWTAIGNRAVGAAVVAASGPDGRAGFLGLSATHLSADPPRLMVSVDARTSALAAIRSSGAFAMSYLAGHHADLPPIFGGRSALKGEERFGTAEWTVLATGAPVLAGAVGAFDCKLEETIERDGTTICIGRLVAATSDPEAEPLIAFRGSYLTLSDVLT